jgi:hypothetical protein
VALPFHNGVRLDGYDNQDTQFTFLLASAIVEADIGKAVSQDGTNPNQVKLAADGDLIVGVLSTYENRAIDGFKTGTVACTFVDLMPVLAGLTGVNVIAVGVSVVGAGGGSIKAPGATKLAGYPYVVEVRGTNAVVVKMS